MRVPIYLLVVAFPVLTTAFTQGLSSESFRVRNRSPRSLQTCRLPPPTPRSIGQLFESANDHKELKGDRKGGNLRDRLRQATGFSFTAFRSAWRAATGVSLSALYASTVVAAGLWIRTISASVLGIFPAWFRYFMQPLLVLYYAPIFILRGLSGPTRKNAIAKHVLLIDGWKEAIDFAGKAEKDGYRPVKWNGT